MTSEKGLEVFLRGQLNSGSIEPQSFLLNLVELHNTHSSERSVQDLIIRCLENREEFKEYGHVLDYLLEARGLFPYKKFDDNFKDKITESIVTSPLTNEGGGSKLFHIKQFDVYQLLMKRKSVILSAPTSFGKTLLVEALIATRTLSNIVIVVPTLSLIDELKKKFHKYTVDSDEFVVKYKIITQVNQAHGKNNIFLYTQERVIEKEGFPVIDFFVVDEFYKLMPQGVDDYRSERLNIAFKKLLSLCSFFYMLGPNIKNINPLTLSKLGCRYIDESDFITVATNEYTFTIPPGNDTERDITRNEYLKKVMNNISGEQTIIYCKSPKRASVLANLLSEIIPLKKEHDLNSLSNWLKETFHPDWSQSKIIQHGICAHHAKLPRSIASLFVDLFNEKRINVLVCTSTLIEGVNTNAKNIIIYDDCITKRVQLDSFTYNNIAGRSGRMFEHFVGNVFFFGEKPTDGLNQIDIPIISHSDNVPDSLLLHYDEPYSEKIKGRLNKYFDQDILSIDVITKNSGVPPESQLEFANDLMENFQSWHKLMCWNNMPNSGQLNHINKIAEKYFNIKSFASGAVKSDVQLSRKIVSILKNETLKDIIDQDYEYFSEDDDSFTIDDAVLRNFDFRRKILGHYYPVIVNAINNIQEYVFTKFGYKAGNYKAFILRVESLNVTPSLMTLEEYGIPISISLKANKIWKVKDSDSFDEAIDKIKSCSLSDDFKLSELELKILEKNIVFL